MKGGKATKRFIEGQTVYGKNGYYEFPDVIAKRLAEQGKFRVTKNISTDAVRAEDALEDKQFVAKIRANAPAILKILTDEAQAQSQAEADAAGEQSGFTPPPSGNGEEEPDDFGGSGTETGEEDENPNETGEETGDGAPSEEAEDLETEETNGNQGSENSEDEEPIPESFPAFKKFQKAGVVFLKDVPRTKEALEEMGLTPGQADQVGVALAEMGLLGNE
jgi:pyruvate dehydrogenase E2 component (dihydrolipoyllysine-residue acetyltransferase)